MLKWPGAEGTKAREPVSRAGFGIQAEWDRSKMGLLHRPSSPT